MSQPIWKLVYATDYSALYTDETGVYSPELAIAQEYGGFVTIYRFSCDRLKASDPDGTMRMIADDAIGSDQLERAGEIENQIRAGELGKGWHLIPLAWNPTWNKNTLPSKRDEWFVKHLASVASYVGETVEELADQLTSDDPCDLARAYEAIGSYLGYDNFDSQPDTWTESEFASWPERGPAIDVDEFISGYIECALWCGVHSPDENATDTVRDLDDSLLTDTARATLERDCRAFVAGNNDSLREYVMLGRSASDAGHDFWLTRNGHGTGFWDRGNEAVYDTLSDACKPYGEQNLYATWDPLDCETEDPKHDDYVAPEDRDVIAIHTD